MATKVHMEALSPTMEEGQLVRWLKKEGDTVQEGDVLAEIETDKATMELVARGSGVLSGISLQDGGTAAVGTVIATIGEAGAAAPADGKSAPKEKPAATETPAAAEAKAAKAEEPAADPVTGLEPEGGKKAAAPETDEAGADAGAGGTDTMGEQEHLTPAAEGTGVEDAAEPEEAASSSSQKAGAADGGRVKASPLARRLAEEAGVELGSVEGTGPGGRITKRDITLAAGTAGGPTAGERAGTAGTAGRPAGAGERAGTAGTAEQPAGAAGAPARAAPAAAGAGAADGGSEEVPVSQMRKAIAKRLAQSIGPVPTFYLTIECDMTRLMELRERTNRVLERDGVKASVNDFLIKAIASALARHPEVNASWGDSVITRHHRVHVGVAVAVEDGLITPIVRDADRKRVRDIAAEVRELAGRARERKLKPEEYTGATFSISNLGMFGIVEFTAIINPPEAGIIAVGAVEEKPVVEAGEVVVRPRMRLTMSCDHRVIDGALGAKFLQTVQEFIEDPMMMLA